MCLSRNGQGPSISQEVWESVLGLGLLALYLIIFTVGSQVPSPTFKAPSSLGEAAWLILTYRETSVCLLSIVAACLGTWRRFYQAKEGVIIATTQPRFLAYVSACIGGLITTAVVVGLPNMLDMVSDQITISRNANDGSGQRNYNAMAMLASAVAFFSGYDKTFLDRLLGLVLRKLGLAAPTTATASPVAAVTGPKCPDCEPIESERSPQAGVKS